MRYKNTAFYISIFFCVALFALYVSRYPISGAGFANTGYLVMPEFGKVFVIFRTLCLLLAINAAAFSLGVWVEIIFPAIADKTELRQILRLGYGFTVLSMLVLMFAALRLLILPVFVSIIVLPSVSMLFVSRRRIRVFLSNAGFSEPRTVFLAIAVFLLTLSPFLGTFCPDRGWDALTYHLALPERYLFENRIVVTPFSIYSAFPLPTEMLYILALAIDGPNLASLLHFQFGILILAAVRTIAGRFSCMAALTGLAFLLSDPLFQYEMSIAYNDLALTFYATLSVRAFWEWTQGGERNSLINSGFFAGACMATRYPGGSIALILCVLVWAVPGRRPVQKFAACLWIGGLSAVILLPWLIRNTIFTGNPVSPVCQSLFQVEYFEPIVIQQAKEFTYNVGMGRGVFSFLAVPWNLTFETIPGVYSNSFGFQIGPLYLIGILAVLLQKKIRQTPMISFFLKFVFAYTVVWFFTFQEARYLLPIFPLVAIMGGAAFQGLFSFDHPLKWIVPAISILALLYCQAAGFGTFLNRYVYAASRLETISSSPPVKAAIVLREKLGPDDKVLLFYESRSFLFSGLDYIAYQPNEGAPLLQTIKRNDSRSLHCEFRKMGITHILVNTANLKKFHTVFVPGYDSGDHTAVLSRFFALIKNNATKVYQKDGILIFKLHSASDC